MRHLVSFCKLCTTYLTDCIFLYFHFLVMWRHCRRSIVLCNACNKFRHGKVEWEAFDWYSTFELDNSCILWIIFYWLCISSNFLWQRHCINAFLLFQFLGAIFCPVIMRYKILGKTGGHQLWRMCRSVGFCQAKGWTHIDVA